MVGEGEPALPSHRQPLDPLRRPRGCMVGEGEAGLTSHRQPWARRGFPGARGEPHAWSSAKRSRAGWTSRIERILGTTEAAFPKPSTGTFALVWVRTERSSRLP